MNTTGMLTIYKNHRLLVNFLVRMGIIVITGMVLLQWLKSIPGLQLKIVNSPAVYYFGKGFMELSRQLLTLFGYTSHARLFRLENMEFVAALCTPGNECLYLAWPCLGIKVTAVFIALIIVFPGNYLHKFWFIPLGIIVIQIFNVLRFTALMIIIYHYPLSDVTNFNLWHLGIGYHEIFNLVLYMVIFGLFIIWIHWYGMYQIIPKAEK